MAFDDLPDLGPMVLPGSAEYSARALELSKAAAAGSRVIWDIPYGDDFFQKLDVFLPDTSGTGLPVLVFLHGGAWRHGYKEWNGFMAPHVAALPAIFVAANYRLAPAAKYPAALQDVVAAVGWVYRHIGARGGDPRRIVLGGHSAGGHLAVLATLRPELFEREGLPADVVKGCYALSAPQDLRLEQCEPGGRRERLIRNFLADDAQDRDASPTEHVRGCRVPFFLAWGERDLEELVAQNRRFAGLLQQEGCPLEHHELAGHTHFDTHLNCVAPGSACARAIVDLLKNRHENCK